MKEAVIAAILFRTGSLKKLLEISSKRGTPIIFLVYFGSTVRDPLRSMMMQYMSIASFRLNLNLNNSK